MITPGQYTFIQTLDPLTGIWRNLATGSSTKYIFSDGNNMRLANLTGFALGAVMTNCGTGYTSAPTVTASTGGSTWKAIVGGAVSTTVTIGTAGSGYNYPPIINFTAPPAGGVQATGYATITAGAVTAVTMVNQGAGYAVAPSVIITPDPRDAAASTPGPIVAAAATTALTGAGLVTAILCTNHGTTAVTALPTLSITGGGGSAAAATVVMCWTLTGLGTVTGGAGFGTSLPFAIITAGGQTSNATLGAVVNPAISTNLLFPREASGSGVSTAGGAITATGFAFTDTGLFSAVPSGFVLAGAAIPTTAGAVTLAVGGTQDLTLIQPI
jgi:hypothetical protein